MGGGRGFRGDHARPPYRKGATPFVRGVVG